MDRNSLFRKAALFVTERCNLRCDYCYQKRNPGDIETDIAKKAIDFLLENSHNFFTLTFFGGEPLINMALLEDLFQYSTEKFTSRGKKVFFSINTNGTLLNKETFTILTRNKVNLILSIDGKKETHDYHRKTSTGGSSFDLIEQNLESIINYPSLQARVTVSPQSISKLVENLDYIAGLGFKNLGIALTRDLDGWNYEILQEQYNLLAEWYIKQMRDNRDVNISDIDLFVAKGKRELKRGRPPCSAGDKSIAVGIDGLIYPCHRFAGYRESAAGDIEKGIDEEKINYYRSFDPYKVKGCEKCSLLSSCYKCMWLSFVKHGNLNTRVETACTESKAFIKAAEKVGKTLLEEKVPSYIKKISHMEEMIRSRGRQ